MRPTISILPVMLATGLVSGCLTTKDMAADGDGSEDGGMSESTGEGGAESSSEDGDPTSTSGNTSSASSSSDGGEDTDDPTTSSASSSSEDGGETDSDPQALCEASGGTWDPGACGDYECGFPLECKAIIPGCDCGFTMNFEPGVGCVEDDECGAGSFPCGDGPPCTIDVDYCEEFIPGVMGADPSFTCMPIPKACTEDPTCDCLATADVFGDCSPVPGGGLHVQIAGA